MLSGAKHLCPFPWANVAETIGDSSPATAGSE